jgi:hypothetical protein
LHVDELPGAEVGKDPPAKRRLVAAERGRLVLVAGTRADLPFCDAGEPLLGGLPKVLRS